MHFQEKILDQHERTLSIQTDTKETQQKRTAIAERRTMVAEKQLMALESHLRAERIRTLKSDVENFRKQHNLLKQQFVNHCKTHPEKDKRDHKSRRKGHKERVAHRGENIDSDSDESADSQAPLLNEMEGIKRLLEDSKKNLESSERSLSFKESN
jgi:hypothetical protein